MPPSNEIDSPTSHTMILHLSMANGGNWMIRRRLSASRATPATPGHGEYLQETTRMEGVHA